MSRTSDALVLCPPALFPLRNTTNAKAYVLISPIAGTNHKFWLPLSSTTTPNISPRSSKAPEPSFSSSRSSETSSAGFSPRSNLVSDHHRICTLAPIIPIAKISPHKIDIGSTPFHSPSAPSIAYRRAKTLAQLNSERWGFETTGPVGKVYVEMYASPAEVAYIEKMIGERERPLLNADSFKTDSSAEDAYIQYMLEEQRRPHSDPRSIKTDLSVLSGSDVPLWSAKERRDDIWRQDPLYNSSERHLAAIILEEGYTNRSAKERTDEIWRQDPLPMPSSPYSNSPNPAGPSNSADKHSEENRARSSSSTTDELWEILWNGDPPPSAPRHFNQATAANFPSPINPATSTNPPSPVNPASRENQATKPTPRKPESALFSALFAEVSQEPESTAAGVVESSLDHVVRKWQDAQYSAGVLEVAAPERQGSSTEQEKVQVQQGRLVRRWWSKRGKGSE